MKRAVIFVLLAACSGSVFAQTEEQKIRDRLGAEVRPLGSPSWPVPRDPNADTNFGTPVAAYPQHRGVYSEQEQLAQRQSQWRRVREQQQNPLGVNLSGDPTFHGRLTSSYSTPSSGATSTYGSSARPYRSGPGTVPYTYGSSSYSSRPQQHYSAPRTYSQAVRQDQSWLRPNFGSSPQTGTSTYNRSSGSSSSSSNPYSYHSSSTTSSGKRCSSYQINC